MILASSFLAFHHCSVFLESCNSLTILASILLSCVIISFTICDPRGKGKRSKLIDQFPGPRVYPFIGSMLDLWFYSTDDTLNWLERIHKRWGDIVRFREWGNNGNPKIFVNSYDIAVEILSRKSSPTKAATFMKYCAPDVHPIGRKFLSPSYSREKLEQTAEMIRTHVLKLIDTLTQYADGGETFNILEYIQLCSYKVGLEVAIGPEITTQLYEDDCKNQITAWQEILGHPTKSSQEASKPVKDCSRRINQFAETLIQLRKSQRKCKDNDVGEDTEGLASAKQNCFLDLLLDLMEKDELKAREVVQELNNYVFAGCDATGTTVTWTLHLLSSHPDCQEKVFQELRQIFPEYKGVDGSSKLEITLSHLDLMNYLESCILEAFRLYPVIPWLHRRIDEDIELKDGRVIPSGVEIQINSIVMHRNTKYFPDPERFSPERYLPHAGDNHNSLQGAYVSLLSFGAEPRTCPAMPFAMHELKITLAHLILNYSWESMDLARNECASPTRMKLSFNGVLTPANGINVRITSRNYKT